MLYMGGKTELDPAPDHVGVGGAVVCTMLKDYLNQGRILYTNNWYTSPALCRHLDILNTGSCGTVRRNRQKLPRLPSRRDQDSRIYKQANGVLLLFYWVDGKEVNILSTVHESVEEPARRPQRGTGLPVNKLQCINDYNINMRLVDKDQVVASAECARKTMRWYRKFFFHLLDLVLYDAHIIYKELTASRETREEFCVELAQELVIAHKAQPIRRPTFGRVPDPGLARLCNW